MEGEVWYLVQSGLRSQRTQEHINNATLCEGRGKTLCLIAHHSHSYSHCHNPNHLHSQSQARACL